MHRLYLGSATGRRPTAKRDSVACASNDEQITTRTTRHQWNQVLERNPEHLRCARGPASSALGEVRVDVGLAGGDPLRRLAVAILEPSTAEIAAEVLRPVQGLVRTADQILGCVGR